MKPEVYFAGKINFGKKAIENSKVGNTSKNFDRQIGSAKKILTKHLTTLDRAVL